jgi:hypothetical protein
MKMNDVLAEGWAKVEGALAGAKSIAWEGCHKIYVLMDDEQTEEMRQYGYDQAPSQLVLVTDPSEALATLREWYDASRECGLQFISAVRTVPAGVDPNVGFTNLIPQFAEDDDEYEE